MAASRRSTVIPAAEAPEVVAARAWVASAGWGGEIAVTRTGRLRVYDLELDAAQFLEMSSEDAFDLLMSAAVRAELGDDSEADTD